MKRLFLLLVLVPIGIIVIALAVANRHLVSLSIPPQVGDGPLYSFSLPLYMIIFATLIAGMLIGSFATWVKQGKHRKMARDNQVVATKMTFEAQKYKERVDDASDTMSNEQRALSALGLPAPSKVA